MADFYFEPPSFSLGLDLDLHSEPQSATPSDPLLQPAKRSSAAVNLCTIEEDDDDDFESPVWVPDQPRTLKRLRHGPTPRLTAEAARAGSEDGRCNLDDEIEDFSSEEDCPRAGNLHINSICSSSKSSLQGHTIVTSESGSHWKSRKGKEVSSASSSGNVETEGGNTIFPKLTVSPLRRFQLIDSDSDDPSVLEDTSKEVPHLILSPKNKQSDSGKHSTLSKVGTKKASIGKCQNQDLWKDFSPENSPHIPTPAFDEVCEEYFTMKNKSKAETGHKDYNSERKLDADSFPPSHCYFFHEDSRIQKLVRNRLPYFFPLVAGSNQEHKLPNVSVIDYMGQFGHDDNTRKIDSRPNVKTTSTRNKRNVKKSQVDDRSHDSKSWVNPKNCAGCPKNAGNRRVQAVSESAGHWYTDSNARRVYVNKNGQELTGQIAYRQYRKESGMGFKKSKKTAAKKSAAPKKSARKKK